MLTGVSQDSGRTPPDYAEEHAELNLTGALCGPVLQDSYQEDGQLGKEGL